MDNKEKKLAILKSIESWIESSEIKLYCLEDMAMEFEDMHSTYEELTNKMSAIKEEIHEQMEMYVQLPIIASSQSNYLHNNTAEYLNYCFPSLDLLQDIKMNPDCVEAQEQHENKERIRKVLNLYGIGVKNIVVHIGPSISLYEVELEIGIRITKIRLLEDDIALSFGTFGIRIIAPIPGRGTIGIEIPNRNPQVVPIREAIASKAFQESEAILPMVLGITVSNLFIVADLTKMPHLLVAGASGGGKSVCLNSIINSLLYKKKPNELKLVLIDPKKVEFNVYSDIKKYYLAKTQEVEDPIINDIEHAKQTLNSLVQEMENRYNTLEQVNVRNIKEYNDKLRLELHDTIDEHGFTYEYMPYIVVVIDEFSDLILTEGKEVEIPVVRIAQKAHAVGIHMIIATQRPSQKVITGLIKANFPGRIAFRVSQIADSRLILDRPGAQQLIGCGDMLFSANGETIRIQCPLIYTSEITNICQFIKAQKNDDKEIINKQPYLLPEYVGKGNDKYYSRLID